MNITIYLFWKNQVSESILKLLCFFLFSRISYYIFYWFNIIAMIKSFKGIQSIKINIYLHYILKDKL